MERPPLTPALVKQTLALLAQLEISDEEAAELIPVIEANQRSLDVLERFEVGEVRSAALFRPHGA